MTIPRPALQCLGAISLVLGGATLGFVARGSTDASGSSVATIAPPRGAPLRQPEGRDSPGSTTTTVPPTTAVSSTTGPPAPISSPTIVAPPTSVAPPPTSAPKPPQIPSQTGPVAPSSTLPSGPTMAGAGPIDSDHPCAVLSTGDVRSATGLEVQVVQTDLRCRYQAESRSDRVVVSILGYPTEATARIAMRDTRQSLADVDTLRCQQVPAGSEAVACEPSRGPVSVVGLVRVATTVVRIDRLAGTAGLADLLVIAGTRMQQQR